MFERIAAKQDGSSQIIEVLNMAPQKAKKCTFYQIGTQKVRSLCLKTRLFIFC